MQEDRLIELKSILKVEALGKGNAVQGNVLSKRLRIKDSTLRSMVNALRKDGEPICSCRKGYWYAKNKEEIETTIQHLEYRAVGINNAIAGLKKALR